VTPPPGEWAPRRTLWTAWPSHEHLWGEATEQAREEVGAMVRLLAQPSPATGARYPVQWQLDVAGTRYQVKARLDNQELDSRQSTGSVYWEGLSALLDAQGRVIGQGYLEMTGYVAPMVL